MNHTAAACGHSVVAIGAPNSDARAECENGPCDRCSEPEAAHLIDGEQAYPIYNIGIRWTQDRTEGAGGYATSGMPCGVMRNGTSLCRMYDSERPCSEIEREIRTEAVDRWIADGKYPGMDNVFVNVEFQRYETWCIAWFSHFTMDHGQSDAEALASFERYVCRSEELNRSLGYHKYGMLPNGAICLMGAEDRWRWRGDPKIDESKPPCRCEHCKSAGLLRIGH